MSLKQLGLSEAVDIVVRVVQLEPTLVERPNSRAVYRGFMLECWFGTQPPL